MSKFIPTTQRILYHAIPHAPEGNAIRTSLNWGMNILPPEREKLGIRPDEHPPLLFAATQLGKALAYAIEKGQGRLCCLTINSIGTEILIAGDRKNFMSRPRHATIYSFSDKGFVNLPNAQHQSVSKNPLPFSETAIACKINSIEDIMRAGLQIFTFKEGAAAIYEDKDAIKIRDAKSPQETLEILTALIACGKVVWENNARNIHPNAALAKQLGIKLKATPAAHLYTRTAQKNRPPRL
jgi:hypothetical protein